MNFNLVHKNNFLKNINFEQNPLNCNKEEATILYNILNDSGFKKNVNKFTSLDQLLNKLKLKSTDLSDDLKNKLTIILKENNHENKFHFFNPYTDRVNLIIKALKKLSENVENNSFFVESTKYRVDISHPKSYFNKIPKFIGNDFELSESLDKFDYSKTKLNDIKKPLEILKTNKIANKIPKFINDFEVSESLDEFISTIVDSKDQINRKIVFENNDACFIKYKNIIIIYKPVNGNGEIYLNIFFYNSNPFLLTFLDISISHYHARLLSLNDFLVGLNICETDFNLLDSVVSCRLPPNCCQIPEQLEYQSQKTEIKNTMLKINNSDCNLIGAKEELLEKLINFKQYLMDKFEINPFEINNELSNYIAKDFKKNLADRNSD
jgi:hypothetical protein